MCHYPLVEIDKLRASVRSLSDEELRREFAQGLCIAAAAVARAAAVLVEMDHRGLAVEGVPVPFLNLLRRVAKGDVLPQIVSRFAARPQQLGRVAALPVAEQREVVEGRREPPEAPKRKRSNVGLTQKDIEERNYLIAAEHATAKDLASTIAEMLGRHPEPEAVWRELQKEPLVKRLRGLKGGLGKG